MRDMMNKPLSAESRPRITEVLIHTIGWCIVFIFPYLMMTRSEFTVTVSDYLCHRLIVPLSFCIVFYVNYFLLIPQYLFKGYMNRYLLWNAVLIIGMTLCVHLWNEYTVQFVAHPTPPPHLHMGPPWWHIVLRDAISMALTAGLCAAICLSRRWVQSEAARHEAEKARTEAELMNLRNQLNPHFLLNTLNNIYALISFDRDKAQTAMQELSRLLRHVLYDNRSPFVSLGKEMDFIRSYIELMRIRLPQNVTVDTSIDIAADSRTEIAPLIFISLIENAFKHGISPTKESYIKIHFSESPGKVQCNIINTYHPKSDTDKSGSGIGLEQVHRRLELTYSNHYDWQHGISVDGKEYYSRLTIFI